MWTEELLMLMFESRLKNALRLNPNQEGSGSNLRFVDDENELFALMNKPHKDISGPVSGIDFEEVTKRAN
jgi:hypothetical protein